ncbi:opioid growth factor receptor-like protein 1 [Dendropsophus ebraccatus]|uniref:opioid growth factor receptor-like protein 1 n=1 Tax=Dendropsophus ebraccatus TaxID=150705 RepID=UPI003831959F
MFNQEAEWNSDYDSTWEDEDEESPKRKKPKSQYQRNYWNRAAKDMQNYRHGYGETHLYTDTYPVHQKYMPNLEFYQNKRPFEPYGVTIEEFHETWREDYEELESNHGFIQWLFPLRERGVNPRATPLTLAELMAMKGDEVVRQRLLESYELMLGFYGIKLLDKETGQVSRSENWEERFYNMNTHTHNNLRITRILKCLGEMGYERLQAPLVQFFLEETLCHNNLPRVKRSVLDYFMFTVRDKQKRRDLVHYAWANYPWEASGEPFIWGPVEKLRNLTNEQENEKEGTRNGGTSEGKRNGGTSEGTRNRGTSEELEDEESLEQEADATAGGGDVAPKDHTPNAVGGPHHNVLQQPETGEGMGEVAQGEEPKVDRLGAQNDDVCLGDALEGEDVKTSHKNEAQTIENNNSGNKEQMAENEISGDEGQIPQKKNSEDDWHMPENKSLGDKGQITENKSSEDNWQITQDKSSRDEGHILENKSSGDEGHILENKSSGDEGQILENKSSGDEGQILENKSSGDEGQKLENKSSRVEGQIVENKSSEDEGYILENKSSGDERHILKNKGLEDERQIPENKSSGDGEEIEDTGLEDEKLITEDTSSGSDRLTTEDNGVKNKQTKVESSLGNEQATESTSCINYNHTLANDNSGNAKLITESTSIGNERLTTEGNSLGNDDMTTGVASPEQETLLTQTREPESLRSEKKQALLSGSGKEEDTCCLVDRILSFNFCCFICLCTQRK